MGLGKFSRTPTQPLPRQLALSPDGLRKWSLRL